MKVYGIRVTPKTGKPYWDGAKEYGPEFYRSRARAKKVLQWLSSRTKTFDIQEVEIPDPEED